MSPQPGMKSGVLKNQRKIRARNRTSTWISCTDILPNWNKGGMLILKNGMIYKKCAVKSIIAGTKIWVKKLLTYCGSFLVNMSPRN